MYTYYVCIFLYWQLNKKIEIFLKITYYLCILTMYVFFYTYYVCLIYYLKFKIIYILTMYVL